MRFDEIFFDQSELFLAGNSKNDNDASDKDDNDTSDKDDNIVDKDTMCNDNNVLQTIVKRSLIDSVKREEKRLEEAGRLNDATAMGVILDLHFDIIKLCIENGDQSSESNSQEHSRPTLLQLLLSLSQEKLIVMMEEVAAGCSPSECDQKVTIVKTRLFIDNFPLIKGRSRAEFYASAEPKRSLKTNMSASKLTLFHVKIIKGTICKDRSLAKYFKCVNEKCRSKENTVLFLSSPLSFIRYSKATTATSTSQCLKCEQCRVDMKELTFSSINEIYHVYDAILLDEMKLIKIKTCKELCEASDYSILGWPTIDYSTGSFKLEAAGIKLLSREEISSPKQCFISCTKIDRLSAILSDHPHLKTLQLIFLLAPHYRVLILSNGDPWNLRAAQTFYGINRAGLLESMKINKITSKQLPHTLLLRPSSLSNRKIFNFAISYEIVLDWSGKRERLKIDESLEAFKPDLIPCNQNQSLMSTGRFKCSMANSSMSVLTDQSKSAIKDQLIIPKDIIPYSLYADRKELIWSDRAKEEMNDYLLNFHERACLLNDRAKLPFHQPIFQMTMLSFIAESAARLADAKKVIEPIDALLASVIGEVLLENRYGSNGSTLTTNNQKVPLSPGQSVLSCSEYQSPSMDPDLGVRIANLRIILRV